MSITDALSGQSFDGITTIFRIMPLSIVGVSQQAPDWQLYRAIKRGYVLVVVFHHNGTEEMESRALMPGHRACDVQRAYILPTILFKQSYRLAQSIATSGHAEAVVGGVQEDPAAGNVASGWTGSSLSTGNIV